VLILQDATKLVRIEELRVGMFATIAHELKTPLTSLSMAVGLCLDELAGPITEKQRTLLESSKEDCARLERRVREFLEIAKVSSGALQLRRQLIPIVDTVDAVFGSLQTLAHENAVTLVRTDVDAALTWNVDGDQMKTALANLVSNAIRYSPKGETVWIKAHLSNNDIHISVRDAGPGIPAEELSKLFHRFYRTPQSLPGGTGLGLYIVSEIATAHGGRAQVTSTVGQGSAFTIEVPSI
jgi:two-component system, NtrC family, sensor histidine kinase KinB